MTDTPDPIPEETDLSALFLAPETPEEEQPEDQDAPDTPDDEDAPEDDQAEDEDAAPEGDEDAPEDEVEDDEDDAPDLITVKVDGEERQVTLDDLKAGYSGDQAVRKRMGEVGAIKQQAMQAFEALQQSQQQVTQLAQRLRSEGMIAPPQPPSTELAKKDPIGFNVAVAEYHQNLAAYQQQQQQIAQVTEQQSLARDAAMKAHVDEQLRILTERIPDFANPETAAKTTAMLQRAGASYGFNEDELQGITDARAIQVLHDAAKYRALQDGKAVAKAKAKKPASKTVKPNAKRAAPPHIARRNQIAKAKASKDPNAVLSVFLEP